MAADPKAELRELFLQVARSIDGATLVAEALAAGAGLAAGRSHVLALGKVAGPMLRGLLAAGGPPPGAGLIIAPEDRLPAAAELPPGFIRCPGDHPTPTARSAAAGAAAADFVARLGPRDHLLVLLSGGGSALAAAPAPGLDLADKIAAVRAVARGGATIRELNAVRKHLSALKGGQLGLLTTAPITVLALSDVVGNDPGTIASGPFSPDATTFAEALAVLQATAPDFAGPALDHLRAGAGGARPETPKPGDPRLAHVRYQILAGPERVPETARALVEASGRLAGLLSRDTEAPVEELAEGYAARARMEAEAGGRPRVFIGNGEPRIVLTGEGGRGGRATHLALLCARAIAGLPGVAFLAAGTDDRDGSTDVSGAVVDGRTWPDALAAGLDPEAALRACDSARPLGALGCLVRGPGTSNLLDLHLLAVSA